MARTCSALLQWGAHKAAHQCKREEDNTWHIQKLVSARNCLRPITCLLSPATSLFYNTVHIFYDKDVLLAAAVGRPLWQSCGLVEATGGEAQRSSAEGPIAPGSHAAVTPFSTHRDKALTRSGAKDASLPVPAETVATCHLHLPTTLLCLLLAAAMAHRTRTPPRPSPCTTPPPSSSPRAPAPTWTRFYSWSLQPAEPALPLDWRL